MKLYTSIENNKGFAFQYLLFMNLIHILIISYIYEMSTLKLYGLKTKDNLTIQ